ncbi:hypothetical protein ID866_2672 [Astraeus odoratus]|nr:hypothetical protein ID866_2672 [Astraeus odoratus]
MADKHIFSSSDGLVLASLRGAVALNPALRLHTTSRTVYDAHPDPSTRIAVVSGGGAGHEPAHAGYTGRGMLTSSVSGDIFASPSTKQILSAISFAAFAGLPQAERPRDVLVIINNYTGDRLNFGLAIEQARSRYPALNIASVLNADDVSLLPQTRSDGQEQSIVGPRGLAGNILVCKVLGSYTTFGPKGVSTPGSPPATLALAKRLGDALVANLRSIGATLGHCHVPGRSPHSGSEIIPPGFIELGLGLHNEPGHQEQDGMAQKSMTLMIPMSHGFGLVMRQYFFSIISEGYLSLRSELRSRPFGLNLVAPIFIHLSTYSIFPVRIYSAPFMTSLNAPGFSISLVNVTRIHELFNNVVMDEAIDVLALLDAPTDAHAWMGVRCWPSKPPITNTHLSTLSVDWPTLGFSPEEITRGVRSACNAALAVEEELTKFDTVLGDGDCGETFSRGARAIISALDKGALEASTTSPAAFISEIGELIEGSMGGTIGAPWSTALLTHPAMMDYSVSRQESAFNMAFTALCTYTPARLGDRTIIDALAPLCTLYSSSSNTATGSITAGIFLESASVPPLVAKRNDTLAHAARVVKEGAESTRGMRPRFGRAVYVGGGGSSHDNSIAERFPDPGAWGIAALVNGFIEGIKNG